MTRNDIPAGYKKNQLGHLVPVSKIDELDLLRDDLVNGIVKNAMHVRSVMKSFKQQSMSDIEAFIQLAAERYKTRLGGTKGNLTLRSYDGEYKISIDVNDSLVFDERLHVAKKMIDDCIHRWTEDSNDNIRALIEHAFQTDKEGNINTGRVLGLMRLKIEDEEWQQAMRALKDSIQIASSKTYLRLYKRVGLDDHYEQVSLDLAGI